MKRLTFCGALVVALASFSVAFAHGVSEADKQAMLSGGNLRYLWLGAQHMLTGYDHLLFLFAVIFFLTRFKDVVKYVTAFTLGHSTTLLFATLLGVSVNYFLIDAVIALSVCYKGFDNNDGFRRYFSTDPPNLLAAVFIFGLIHGFGLSTRLQLLPLEKDGLVLRILSFNVGVEIGQVVALVVMIFILQNWRRMASFGRFSFTANNALVAAGVFLFLMQMHGYTHAIFSQEFGFNADAHYHVHQHMQADSAPEVPVVDARITRALLPFLEGSTTKEAVIESLGRQWKYRDDSGKIVAYGMAFDGSDGLVVRAPGSGSTPYELVLVFDAQDRLTQHSLVKVE